MKRILPHCIILCLLFCLENNLLAQAECGEIYAPISAPSDLVAGVAQADLTNYYVIPVPESTNEELPDLVYVFSPLDGTEMIYAENDSYGLEQSLHLAACSQGTVSGIAIKKDRLYNLLGIVANPDVCSSLIPDPSICPLLDSIYQTFSGPADINMNVIVTFLAAVQGDPPANFDSLKTVLAAVDSVASALGFCYAISNNGMGEDFTIANVLPTPGSLPCTLFTEALDENNFRAIQQDKQLLVQSTQSGVLSLYDQRGILIKSDTIAEGTSHFDMSFLPPGMYYAQFNGSRQRIHFRVLQN